jgi:hypothetical protein
MADDEQLAILRQGAQVWNEWCRGHLRTTPNLTGADNLNPHLRNGRLPPDPPVWWA